MTTPTPTPAPSFGYSATPPKKQVLWKWSLTAAGILLCFLMWQCGSTIYQGRNLANTATKEFHERLNRGRYEEIYQEADEGFTRGGKHEELVSFLAAVHAKLGNAGPGSLANMRVNATTGGTFVVTQYNTTFEHGSAVETFVWAKSNGGLKLYRYDIRSNALVMN